MQRQPQLQRQPELKTGLACSVKTVGNAKYINGTAVLVLPDGNCMFSAALSELRRLGLSCDTSLKLRSVLLSWVSKNGEKVCNGLKIRQWIEYETGETLENYVKRMRRPSEWGGVVELHALVQVFSVSVIVWELADAAGSCSHRHQLVSSDGPSAMSSTPPTVHLFYNGVSHYNIFVPDAAASLTALHATTSSATRVAALDAASTLASRATLDAALDAAGHGTMSATSLGPSSSTSLVLSGATVLASSDTACLSFSDADSLSFSDAGAPSCGQSSVGDLRLRKEAADHIFRNERSDQPAAACVTMLVVLFAAEVCSRSPAASGEFVSLLRVRYSEVI